MKARSDVADPLESDRNESPPWFSWTRLLRKKNDCTFWTSTRTADSQVEKFPYSCRQLFMIRFLSSVRIGETSPAEWYEIAEPIVPEISQLEMLCCASRSVFRAK